jgi:hypothetical protein
MFAPSKGAEQGEAIHVRQVVVDNHDVRGELLRRQEGLLARPRKDDFIAVQT